MLKAAIIYILSFDLLTFSNICTVSYVTVECVELNWLCNHVKKVRSRQASISINSSAELSKTQLFPVGIVNHFFVEMCEWWNYSKTTIYSLYSKIIYNNIWHNLYEVKIICANLYEISLCHWNIFYIIWIWMQVINF